MKNIFVSFCVLCFSLLNSTAFAEEQMMHLQSATVSKEDKQKVSETFGNFIGKNLNTPGLEMDIDMVIEGIKKGAKGEPAPLDQKEFETLMAVMQAQAIQELATKNKDEAETFLAINKTKKGVVSLEDGKVQYEVLKEGSGKVVEADFSPKINYKGSYIDGTVFGSSEEAGGPITVPLNQTVPGFSKGIVGMKEGEKRKLYVHPDLGYGTSGALKPNALLIFEVEVLEADSKEKLADTEEK